MASGSEGDASAGRWARFAARFRVRFGTTPDQYLIVVAVGALVGLAMRWPQGEPVTGMIGGAIIVPAMFTLLRWSRRRL